MSKPFAGKVALVTGGNSGIGRATAIKFAEGGAKVVIAARRKAEGEETVRLVQKAGGEAMFIQADVSQSVQVEAMVARTVAAYGRLDCAFNNAGVGGSGPLMESSEADFDRMIAVNLKGVFLCMRFELAQMLKQGSGAIVNDSSGAGLVAGSYNAVYAASKFGVVALTKSAALSYGRNGIRVNAVCPGYTRTPMLEAGLARDPSLEKKFELRTPLHRIADAREVAEAAVWLCSDAASFINGVALPVDGGLTAGNHWPPNQ